MGQGHCIETAKKNTAVFKWAFSYNGASMYARWNIFRRTHLHTRSVRTGRSEISDPKKKLKAKASGHPVICGDVDFAQEENVN